MSIFTIRLVLLLLAFLLVGIIFLIIKRIAKLEREGNPTCLAWYFGTVLYGLLLALDLVIFIATFSL